MTWKAGSGRYGSVLNHFGSTTPVLPFYSLIFFFFRRQKCIVLTFVYGANFVVVF
jgi:hypothetical protein